MIPKDFLQVIANKHNLSNAELEVVYLAMEGESTADIGKQLGISGDAVRKRLSEVYQKFQISGRGPVKLTKLQQLLVNLYSSSKVETLNFSTTNNSAPSNKPSNKIDWDVAPDVPMFYGRTEEISTLEHWIIEDSCRIVTVQGMGGIGKTALCVQLLHKIKHQFDYVIWRSLRQRPPLSDLVTDLIISLSNQQLTPNLNQLDQQISWLISSLSSKRCLVVLDGFESILSSGNLAGIYREGYEKYGKMLSRLGQKPLKSCILLTSREKVLELSILEGKTSPVRSLQLEGLNTQAAPLLLQEKGLSGEEHWDNLIGVYRGNPFMLKLVAITIKEVFDGNVTDFLTTTVFTHDISNFVSETLRRLSDLEAKIIMEMSKNEEPLSFAELQNQLPEASPQDLVSAVASLRQRSLIEKSEGRFSLTPVVRAVEIPHEQVLLPIK